MRGSSRAGRGLVGPLAFGTALLALLVPATSSAADYVAMGDSYSSGTGTRDYYDATKLKQVKLVKRDRNRG